MRRRAEFFYQQLDALQALRQQVRRDLLAESRRHNERKLLRQIPSIGPIRSAVLLGILQTESAPSPGIFSGGGRGVLETLWFESESQPIS